MNFAMKTTRAGGFLALLFNVFLSGTASAQYSTSASAPIGSQLDPSLVQPECLAIPTLNDQGRPWAADDPKLKCGDLTVWKLQEMAERGSDKDLKALDYLFAHGLTMERLPIGKSAGAGKPFPNIHDQKEMLGDLLGKNLLGSFLEGMTGALWKGKLFCSSQAEASNGRNRIRTGVPLGHYFPTAKFRAFLLSGGQSQNVFTQPELVDGLRSNFVVLNYADPVTGANWFVEGVLKNVIPVFDVMVAVPGKYGPVYVGKTWYGKYDAQSKAFTTYFPDVLIARYYLDFNAEALNVQKERYWNKSIMGRVAENDMNFSFCEADKH